MPSPELTVLVEQAIRDYIVLELTYHALDDTVATHEVEPLAIRFNTAGHRVLWCFSRDAGHVEELLWDRIEDASETGQTFVPRRWEEAAERQSAGGGRLRGGRRRGPGGRPVAQPIKQ